jgi:hypothetical protein
MKKERNDKDETPKRKAYVTPTVAKHTAASLVVGSACSSYNANTLNPNGCAAGVVTNTITTYSNG